MRWLTLTHTQRWHANRHTSGTGPIYQGRFKSFPVQSDEHLLTVARYIERNPLRAGMVENAEQWQWSSLWRRCQADAALCEILSDWPVEAPGDWSRWVQQPHTEAELEAVRRSVPAGPAVRRGQLAGALPSNSAWSPCFVPPADNRRRLNHDLLRIDFRPLCVSLKA